MDNVFSHRFYAFTISDDGRVTVISIVRAADHAAAVIAVNSDFERRAGLARYQRTMHADNPDVIAEVDRQAEQNERLFEDWTNGGQPIRIADNG